MNISTLEEQPARMFQNKGTSYSVTLHLIPGEHKSELYLHAAEFEVYIIS
jgi:hypothetical protein